MVRAVVVAMIAATTACGPIVLEADPLAAPGPDAGFSDAGIDGGVVDSGVVPRDGGPSDRADVNSDGCVDRSDLDLVQALWGEMGGQGDANGDGIVDVRDLNLVLAAWGTGCPDAGVRDSGNDTGNRR